MQKNVVALIASVARAYLFNTIFDVTPCMYLLAICKVAFLLETLPAADLASHQ